MYYAIIFLFFSSLFSFFTQAAQQHAALNRGNSMPQCLSQFPELYENYYVHLSDTPVKAYVYDSARDLDRKHGSERRVTFAQNTIVTRITGKLVEEKKDQKRNNELIPHEKKVGAAVFIGFAIILTTVILTNPSESQSQDLPNSNSTSLLANTTLPFNLTRAASPVRLHLIKTNNQTNIRHNLRKQLNKFTFQPSKRNNRR